MERDFEFVSFGPIFREQQSTKLHRDFRARTGALESLLASEREMDHSED
jgi:hypothetical protein